LGLQAMSFVPRLYLPSILENQNEITLDESASRYLVKVLRMEEGDRARGFDDQGRQYELTLKKIEGQRVHATVLSRREPPPELESLSLTLGQSLPKSSKMDLILRQGTEAGVHRFLPILTQRSVSRPEESQWNHKNERWGKILVEACRQCGRTDLPHLDGVSDWLKVLESFKEFDLVLLPYEGEAPTLRTMLESKPQARKILVLIGPEGGWAPQEVRDAEEKGAAPVHLPTPILRTETAGIVTASMIRFFYASAPEGAS
jgi:16S rRNA (uracil1498-N3)-methyltransferase